MTRAKTVLVSSVFPVSPDEIWKRLTRVETLQYIAAPFAFFSPIAPDKEMVWGEGETSQFRLRIFGFLPVGIHTIQVCRFDHTTYRVDTREDQKEALKLPEEIGVMGAAQRLGISVKTLYSWRKK